MIKPNHDELSVREQCILLGLNRSTLYYAPRKIDNETDTLMRQIDELHTAHITWGSRKIRDALRLEGWAVNRKRVQRLMRLMRLRVVFPQSHHERLPPDHEVYPYLLRGVSIERPNQVWSIDLTYIRLGDGFVYLTAIIDWFSRKILSWDVSLTLDKSSAIEVLERALRRYGAPEIFNSDQGVQFTSPKFLDPLKEASVNGRQRSCPGQCDHRAVLAHHQVRRGISERLHVPGGSTGANRGLHLDVQWQAPS